MRIALVLRGWAPGWTGGWPSKRIRSIAASQMTQARCGAARTGLHRLVDGVADLTLERPQCLFGGLAPVGF